MYGLDITKPTLFLDPHRARRNIARMAKKARKAGVVLRPHFKTHQSAAIGEWFREEGVTAITVSSVDMARYFADHGWVDITIAFPVNLRQLAEIDALASRVRLHVVVESDITLAALQLALTHFAVVWLKIDAGYGRTGIPWEETDRIQRLAEMIVAAPQLHFGGLLTHGGHSYHASGPAEIREIFHSSTAHITAARTVLEAAGLETAVSVGDTPGCSLVETFGTAHEIRPGNFVFYDVMQLELGACTAADIAVAVACPVVAKHPTGRRIVLYGGAVHLSKEQISRNGYPCFGLIAGPDDKTWGRPIANSAVISLAQEHGIVHASSELFGRTLIGDYLFVLPVHSCLTVDLFPHYHTPDGGLLAKMVTNA